MALLRYVSPVARARCRWLLRPPGIARVGPSLLESYTGS